MLKTMAIKETEKACVRVPLIKLTTKENSICSVSHTAEAHHKRKTILVVYHAMLKWISFLFFFIWDCMGSVCGSHFISFHLWIASGSCDKKKKQIVKVQEEEEALNPIELLQ